MKYFAAVFVLCLFVVSFQPESHSELAPGVGTLEECQLSCPQENAEECQACCAALAKQHQLQCRPDYKPPPCPGPYDEDRCKAEELKRERDCERNSIDFNQCLSGPPSDDILNFSSDEIKN